MLARGLKFLKITGWSDWDEHTGCTVAPLAEGDIRKYYPSEAAHVRRWLATALAGDTLEVEFHYDTAGLIVAVPETALATKLTDLTDAYDPPLADAGQLVEP